MEKLPLQMRCIRAETNQWEIGNGTAPPAAQLLTFPSEGKIRTLWVEHVLGGELTVCCCCLDVKRTSIVVIIKPGATVTQREAFCAALTERCEIAS